MAGVGLIVFIVLCTVPILKAISPIVLENCPITHEAKSGGVYVEISIDDFNNLGFKYGDSVDVKFSNGYELQDLPYYNGYYVNTGNPLLIAYPDYDYIKVDINHGEDLWTQANLTKDDTVTIKLNIREKYLKIQSSRDLRYSDTQGDTPDAVFANFRKVKVGNIKDGVLYRSASPINNSRNRAPVADRLMSAAGIKYIVNLSDGKKEIEKNSSESNFDSPYFLSLYKKNKVMPLSMDFQFKSQGFKKKLAKGLTAMADNPGPYLIHCVEGKDRTGYVLMVLESLLGASYEEIVSDYMITYDNYYDITKENDPDRYEIIKGENIDLMLHYLIGDEEENQSLSEISDYSTYARDYLKSIGLSEKSITKLVQNLSR